MTAEILESGTGPGLHVVETEDFSGRRMVTVVMRHDLPPHDVIGHVDVRTIAELQALIRRLKAKHDNLIEGVRHQAGARRPT
ncbi:hypothetical protein D1122_01440 [Cereibacter sphaeroides]|uniref:hypothetical protein n=1 Tax=Cereibacter sphaeroides TaxID=1063 RepID=UPI000E5AB12D|nr:hypothetical protein [Cereibacter sphaeroides]RIA01352.1 hypothetical protein D1122_01440 [Cereibacter sphaeroides]